jgi:hypothetical protein
MKSFRIPLRFFLRYLLTAATVSTCGLLPSLAVAQDPSEADASASAAGGVVISDKARSHFRAGVNLLQDPDGARYEEAYRQFVTAYQDSPSWKILSNLGLTAMKLERDGEAIEAFETYLKEGGSELDEQERTQISRDLETLQASVSTLEITASPSDVRIIDERLATGGSVLNEYSVPASGKLTLKIRSGRHKVTARLSGHDDATWELQASPATTQEHTFDLNRPDATPVATAAARAAHADAAPQDSGPSSGGPSGLRIGSYVALGVGVAALGVGTFFAFDSKKAAKNVEELCGGNPAQCEVDPGSDESDEVNEENDRAGSSKTLAIVGFAVGGAAIATGVTLFILSMKDGKSTAQLQQERQTQRPLTPYVGWGQLGLTGRF